MYINNNQKKRESQNFLAQGSILAIAGIIVRIIGLVYRIPMIAIIGEKGHGYYTSAYSIYALCLILSTYSLPAAISKVLSHRLAKGRYKDAAKVINVSFVFATILGFTLFMIMYFGSPAISAFLCKPLLVFALRALAPTIFIMAFLSVMRGIFQGTGNMFPTAVSQIFEQIANAIASIVCASILFNKGIMANSIYETTEYEYAFGAKGGAIGTGVGAFVALLVMSVMICGLLRKIKRLSKTNNNLPEESTSEIYSALIMTIIPIILTSFVYNASTVVDDFIYSRMTTFMGDQESIVVMWGVFGQYHILFNIPVAIASSLTSSIIPSITKSVAVKNAKEIVLKIKYSFKFTMMIVLPAFIGLFVMAEPICKLLFNGENVGTLISMLRIGSIAVVLFSLSTLTNGILIGLGLFRATVKNTLISLVLHIILTALLIYPVGLGIHSVIFSNIAFAFFIFIMNYVDINKVVRYKNKKFSRGLLINYIFLILSAACMGVTCYFIMNVLNNILGNPCENASALKIQLVILVIVTIFISVLVYAVFIILLGVVRKRDAEYIPFVSKIQFALRP